MLSHRKGVLLDGIGSELVRASTGGVRKTLSKWLADLSAAINLGDVASTFTSGDATPSVLNNSKFITDGSTAITNFDDGVEGQTITIYRGTSDIVITDNATIDPIIAGNLSLTAARPSATFRLASGVWKQVEEAGAISTALLSLVQGTQQAFAAGLSFISTGASFARTLLARFSDVRRAEDFGAAADGATDDAAAIQALLTAGFVWKPVSGKSYAIGTRINITVDGTGYKGDRTATLVLLSGAGKFDNSSAIAGDRYGTNAVGVYASGVARPILKGLRIKYETQTDDRYVKAIALRNCTDIVVRNNEAWNFTKALGVIYLGACTGGSVSNNHVHDCTTNSATTGQITGIEFDNDDTLSSAIDVDGNRIENLTVGNSFLTAFGYQTDGINVTKQTSARLRIRGNYIKNVGEGIDHFGVDCTISGNIIESCYNFGLKLVHGASRNIVTANDIISCGISGIDLDGSALVAQDTADNFIFGNYIYNIDPNGTHVAAETAGIRFNANGGTTYLPRRNHVTDNVIDLGTNGKHGVLAASGSGTLNYVLRNRVRNAVTANFTLDATAVPYFYTETAGNIATSGTLDLGGATDTTIARSGAGDITVEGNRIFRAGGADIPIADGGTAASTSVGGFDSLSAQGADIASATTTDIGAATGPYVNITGTVTITGLGTVAAGTQRKVKFASALTLTHNGTSLILPGSANITTAANDTAEFVSLGSGNWLCNWYKKQDGTPVTNLAATAAQAKDTTDTTHLLTPANLLDVGAARTLFKLAAANMNSTGDQSFVKQGTFTSYLIVSMRCVQATNSSASAVGGIYTGASKSGDIFVAASQAYAGVTATGTGQGLAFTAVSSGIRTETPILSLSTPQGSAATADFYIVGVPLS